MDLPASAIESFRVGIAPPIVIGSERCMSCTGKGSARECQMCCGPSAPYQEFSQRKKLELGRCPRSEEDLRSVLLWTR